MLKEVLWYIDKQISSLGSRKMNVFDGTLGHGGHLLAIMRQYGWSIWSYVATDTDQRMLDVAQQRLSVLSQDEWVDCSGVSLIHDVYTHLWEIATQKSINYDLVFLDLWVNLWHFKQHERGFSIKWEGELDMRYDTDNGSLMTAKEILATYSYDQLVEMFTLNSEISLPTSSSIAQEIVRMRDARPWVTTTQLNNLTKKLNYSARVAAIVFQALRIEVNKEFDSLTRAIVTTSMCVNPWAVLIILTYHSIEDRIVKNAFKELEENNKWVIITKHALSPSYKEVQSNKPSRSARLRAFRFT